jgi:uncharacterized protein with ATP-grasp and redox domains
VDPGVLLSHCSDEFNAGFRSADVVIAKGQRNFETLSEIDREDTDAHRDVVRRSGLSTTRRS